MIYEFITEGARDAVKLREIRRHEAIMFIWSVIRVIAVLLLSLVIIVLERFAIAFRAGMP